MRRARVVVASSLALGIVAAASAQPHYNLPGLYLSYANDYFRATDYYFTQGIRLEYVGRSRWGIYVAQDGYTPTSLADPDLRPADRPYAGTLYGGLRRRYTRPDHGAELRLSSLLGIIGPWAKGGEQQAYIHRQIDDEEPMGWKHQIANDLLIGVEARYRHRLLERRYLRAVAVGQASLSSYKTRLELGTHLRVGWPRLALRAEPAAVLPLYDATLQGGAFTRDSPHTFTRASLAPLVGRIEVGVQAHLGRVEIDFAHVYLSREFREGRRHAWGRLSVGYLIH